MSGGTLEAMQLVGGALGPVLGGIEQRSALRASAASDRENARRTVDQGEYDAAQTRREARLAIGAGLAQQAADGNVIGTGTALDLVEQALLERELEIGNIRFRAQGEAAALRTEAAGKERAGAMALAQGLLGGALNYAVTKDAIRGQARVGKQTGKERAVRMGASTIAPGEDRVLDAIRLRRQLWGAPARRGF